MGDVRLLFSRRRVLEHCAVYWRDEEDVLAEAAAGVGGVSDHLRSALPQLAELGLIERDRYSVRLTDAGIAHVATQGPGYTDLIGR